MRIYVASSWRAEMLTNFEGATLPAPFWLARKIWRDRSLTWAEALALIGWSRTAAYRHLEPTTKGLGPRVRVTSRRQLSRTRPSAFHSPHTASNCITGNGD